LGILKFEGLASGSEVLDVTTTTELETSVSSPPVWLKVSEVEKEREGEEKKEGREE